MSEEGFKPEDPQYTKVADLPESERVNFVDLPEGGFVRKEAADHLASKEKHGKFLSGLPWRTKEDNTATGLMMEDERRRIYDLEQEKASWLKKLSREMGGVELRYASDELKADPEVVLAAVETWGPAIQDASESLLQDKDFIKKVFSKDRPYMHNLEDIWGQPSAFLERINKMHDLHITWHY